MTRYAHDGRANNFHLIRHFAALCVILTHSYSIPTGRYASEPLVSLTGTSIGHYAVDVFFLLSGFLVTQSVVRNDDLVRYAFGRLLRVFPALLVAVLFTALILGPIVSSLHPSTYFSDPSVWQYVAGAGSTLQVDRSLPGVFTSLPEASKVNVPLWTLKYELAAYVLLGVLVAMSRLRLQRILYVALFALFVAYVWGRFQQPWSASSGALNNLLHLLPAFFIGSAAYLCRKHIPLGPPLILSLALLAYLLRDTVAYEVSEKLLFASVILWIAFLPSSPSEAFARSGDFSYGLYIFAFPIQQTIFTLNSEIDPIAFFVISVLFTLPVAALSWYLLEKPSMRARDGLVKRFRSLCRIEIVTGKLKKIGLRRF